MDKLSFYTEDTRNYFNVDILPIVLDKRKKSDCDKLVNIFHQPHACFAVVPLTRFDCIIPCSAVIALF